MTPEIAQGVTFGITAVGLVVWLGALTFLLKSAQLMQSRRPEGFDEPAAEKSLTGRVEIDGNPRDLAAKAAALLAAGVLGPVKIVEKTDDRIRFERLVLGGKQPAARWFRTGEFRFTALGRNRTLVEWSAKPSAFRWLLGVGSLVQILGLIGLIVGGWAVSSFLAASPNPSVRWQSLQMLQIVHVLWPPFLFGGLYRHGVRGVTTAFAALADNLPYLAEQA